jgi:hypothetical protein
LLREVWKGEAFGTRKTGTSQEHELEKKTNRNEARGKKRRKKKAQMGQTHPNASKNPLCISSLSELARLQYPRSKSDLPAILLITVQLT